MVQLYFLIMRIISTSDEVTMTVAAAFARNSRAGMVYGLTGTLGSGKTTFVKGFVRALSGDVATSPTFVIMHTYEMRIPVHHVDMYRIKAEDLFATGIFDLMKDGITIIEWSERAREAVDFGIEIAFSHSDESSRTLEVSWNPQLDDVIRSVNLELDKSVVKREA